MSAQSDYEDAARRTRVVMYETSIEMYEGFARSAQPKRFHKITLYIYYVILVCTALLALLYYVTWISGGKAWYWGPLNTLWTAVWINNIRMQRKTIRLQSERHAHWLASAAEAREQLAQIDPHNAFLVEIIDEEP